jgi:hypothetical protein
VTESNGKLSYEQVDTELERRVRRVIDLRSGLGFPSLSDGPIAVLEALTEARVRLDQVEHLLSELIRLRGFTRRVARQVRDTTDDAWAEHVSSASNRRPGRGDFGDPAPRERYADADLAVLAQRRNERKLSEQADRASEAVDVAQLAHRGLSDLRRDLHVMLRAMEVESSLER